MTRKVNQVWKGGRIGSSSPVTLLDQSTFPDPCGLLPDLLLMQLSNEGRKGLPWGKQMFHFPGKSSDFKGLTPMKYSNLNLE